MFLRAFLVTKMSLEHLILKININWVGFKLCINQILKPGMYVSVKKKDNFTGSLHISFKLVWNKKFEQQS